MISAMRQRVWVIAFERCSKPEDVRHMLAGAGFKRCPFCGGETEKDAREAWNTRATE